MITINIALTPLTAEYFAAYGSILTPASGKVTYKDENFSWYARRLTETFRGDLSFGILRTQSGLLEQSRFERHRRTPEILHSIEGSVILVLAQPGACSLEQQGSQDGCSLNKSRITAFLMLQGETVVISPGVWHYTPMAIDKSAKVLIIYREGTEEDDVESINLLDHGLLIRVSY